MKSSSRHGKAAFTLIELMAVITIIVILAALVVSGLSFVNDRQAKDKAKIQIALISKALEEYKLDMGTYPGVAADTPAAGTVSKELYQALFKDGYDYTSAATPPANWTKATKIYLPTLDPLSSKQGWVAPATGTTPPADVKITDPWGNEYRYRKGKDAQNPDFDLWSVGKDAKTNTENLKHKDNLDDIKNF